MAVRYIVALGLTSHSTSIRRFRHGQFCDRLSSLWISCSSVFIFVILCSWWHRHAAQPHTALYDFNIVFIRHPGIHFVFFIQPESSWFWVLITEPPERLCKSYIEMTWDQIHCISFKCPLHVNYNIFCHLSLLVFIFCNLFSLSHKIQEEEEY